MADLRMCETSTLIPYARNPRRNEGAVKKVAASIAEFGFQSPIICNQENVVLAGHTRLAAAGVLGIGTVPVLFVDEDWSEQKQRAFRITDNRSAEEAEWDYEMLGVEIEDLATHGFDMTVLGFDQSEFDRIINTHESEGGGSRTIGVDKNTVVVECESEKACQELYEELSERGLQCTLMS